MVVGGDEKEEENGENEPEGADYEVDEAHQALPISDRRKQKRLEVFVGGLDKETTEEDLTSVFKKVGDVLEVRLMKNPQTGKNKGYAFIRYATAALAKKAAQELERVEVSSSHADPVTNFSSCTCCNIHQCSPTFGRATIVNCSWSIILFRIFVCRSEVVLVVYCQVKRMIHYSWVILASPGRKIR